MRLLDLFCGAGGASMGYHRAGFEVVGVDWRPQPRYPFDLWVVDARELEPWVLAGFDAVHASPPCQAHSATRNMRPDRQLPDLIPWTRALLEASGRPWIIENVLGAPLINPVMLCGSSFGLNLMRHRLFEASFGLLVPPCQHGWQEPRFATSPPGSSAGPRRKGLASVVSVSGHPTEFYAVDQWPLDGGPDYLGGVALWREAMGIDWMGRDELAQAIPPVYTECLGYQLTAHVASQQEAV